MEQLTSGDRALIDPLFWRSSFPPAKHIKVTESNIGFCTPVGMPELPESEVQFAVNLIRTSGQGKTIERVETVEDALVFSGISDREFASEITGRTLLDAGRYGKYMFFNLDGVGKMPVLHLGMTGIMQVQGQTPIQYRRNTKDQADAWPPRFMKFILHLRDRGSNSSVQVAFSDPRRLGRVRLCSSPLSDPPISELGFDPLISLPPIESFKTSVIKRSCPIKSLLLDQSFSAGIGNYLADEVLYHARIHPTQRCNTLTDTQLNALYHQTADVCRIAVEADADASKYPSDWLFQHRWGKGKKAKHTMKLPCGTPATIEWMTVGGRTSAYVVELQVLPSPNAGSHDGEESEPDEVSALSPSASGVREVETQGQKRKAASRTQSHRKISRTRLA